MARGPQMRLLWLLAGGLGLAAAAPGQGCRPSAGLTPKDLVDTVCHIQVTVNVEPNLSPPEDFNNNRTIIKRRWDHVNKWNPGDEPLVHVNITGLPPSPRLRSRWRQAGAAIACVVGCFAVALVIAMVYWDKGMQVILKILAYLAALVAIMISIKHIYVEYSFTFPKFITAFHMLFSAIFGFAALAHKARTTDKTVIMPTAWEYVSRILPISALFGGAVGLSNIGLLSVSPFLAEIVGALNPLISALGTIMMGMPFRYILLVPIAITVVGGVMAVQPWITGGSVGGLVCLVVATVFRSMKTVLQQEVMMTGAINGRFDEYMLLAWSCATSCIMMFVWSFISERGEPWQHFASNDRKGPLALHLVVSTIIAILVNLSHLWVTKVLGAVSSTLLAQAKAVLVLLGSIALLGETASRIEIIGFSLVLFGTFSYGIMQQALLPARK